MRQDEATEQSRRLLVYTTCCRGGYLAPIPDWKGSAGSELRGSSLGSMKGKCLSSTATCNREGSGVDMKRRQKQMIIKVKTANAKNT